jgi:DNA-binding NtrC family response regulator
MKTTTPLRRPERPDLPSSIVVLGPGCFETVTLTGNNTLSVGRGENCEIRIEDPAASRIHARLYVGERGLEIEDAGSANGTQFRGEDLPSGVKIPLVPGDVVAMGATALIVQGSRVQEVPTRVLPHGYFQIRLDEECRRSRDSRNPFAVFRIDFGPESTLDRALSSLMPLIPLHAVVAAYGRQSLEVLMPGLSGDAAHALGEALPEFLHRSGVIAQVGTSAFPEEGTSADALLARACREVRQEQEQPLHSEGVLILDKDMKDLYRLAHKIAAGIISVLVVGETGCGKELLAATIHRASPRAGKPYLCINCAALSETLLESELFGHERGAFTGAAQAKSGLLEMAPGGTVFLDEIGEMPLSLQAKLLRVLETRQLVRVGGTSPRSIDVRFVSATNRSLLQEVEAGRFRKDLYFRLGGATLVIPPLRQRKSEILPLARLFIGQLSRQLAAAEPVLSSEAAVLLEAYDWSGNVRELRNVIERAILLADDGEIKPSHLPVEIMAIKTVSADSSLLASWFKATSSGEGEEGRPRDGAEDLGPLALPCLPDCPYPPEERERVLDALARTAGNQSAAAKLLGLSRSALIARLRAFELPRPRRSKTLNEDTVGP